MSVFECLCRQNCYRRILPRHKRKYLDTKGNKFETPVCRFDDLDGVSFSVVCQATPFNINNINDLKVSVKSQTSLKLSCFFDGTAAAHATFEAYSYFQHASIKNLCKDGKLNINATVTYETNPYAPTVAPNSLQLQPHELIGSAEDSTDAEIGEEKIKIHRGFLSIVSPVFKAMFGHNTKESKDGIVNVKDMDAAVVKDSINILYGHSVELETIPQAIGILKFFEKYLIKSATDRLESWISEKLNLTDFVAVINYAWDHSSENLQKGCREFFYENPRFAFTEQYRKLPFDIIMSLSTHEDRLETWLIDHLTVDDFDAVIKHAWDYESDKLKNICAQFYYDNLEFTLTPGFRKMDAGIAKELADYAGNQAKGDVDQLHD